MTIIGWLSARFGAPSVLSPESVSNFIEFPPARETFSGLTEDELSWIVLFDIVEDERRYRAIFPALPKHEKMFILAARHYFATVQRTLSIDFDIWELWRRSGCQDHIY